MELNLFRDVKGIKKGFYRYLGSKRKTKENVGQLLNSVGNLVTKNTEKAKVPSAFFTLIFTSKSDLQAFQVPQTWEKIWSKVQLSFICVILYLILHLHYMWLLQPVNSCRQEVCSLIWLQKEVTWFMLNSVSGGILKMTVALNGFALCENTLPINNPCLILNLVSFPGLSAHVQITKLQIPSRFQRPGLVAVCSNPQTPCHAVQSAPPTPSDSRKS